MKFLRCFLAFCLFAAFSNLSQATNYKEDDKDDILLPCAAIFTQNILEDSNNRGLAVLLTGTDISNSTKFAKSLVDEDNQPTDFIAFSPNGQTQFRIYDRPGKIHDAAVILIQDDFINVINIFRQVMDDSDFEKYKLITLRYDEKTCEFNAAVCLKDYNPTTNTRISCSPDNARILGRDLFIKIENKLFEHLYYGIGQ